MHLHLRPFTWDDIDAIVDLARACEEADHTGRVMTAEILELQLRVPGVDPTRTAWLLPSDAEGLVAMCSFPSMPGPEQEVIHISVAIRPGYRGGDLEDRLMRFAEERSLPLRKRPDLPALWHRGLRSNWSDRIAACELRGYTAARWFMELERGLLSDLPDAPPPDGIEIAVSETPADMRDLNGVLNEAFHDHWNPVEFTAEQFDHYVNAPAMQPLLPLLARSTDGAPAGGCILRVEREKNEQHGTAEGDVSVLGVLRPFRGRGVARALLSRGLRWLAEQGMEVATITVDSQSPTGADRLYASVGFVERTRTVVYEKPVPAR